MNEPHLIFSLSPKRSSDLIIGTLTIVGLTAAKIVYPATSGIPGWQQLKQCWERGKGIIPPSNAVKELYTVSTRSAPCPNPRATGGENFSIFPLEVFQANGELRRTMFSVHLDANHATSPGSAGCIVLLTSEEWYGFKQDMDRVAEGSKGSRVNLLVQYE